MAGGRRRAPHGGQRIRSGGRLARRWPVPDRRTAERDLRAGGELGIQRESSDGGWHGPAWRRGTGQRQRPTRGRVRLASASRWCRCTAACDRSRRTAVQRLRDQPRAACRASAARGPWAARGAGGSMPGRRRGSTRAGAHAGQGQHAAPARDTAQNALSGQGQRVVDSGTPHYGQHAGGSQHAGHSGVPQHAAQVKAAQHPARAALEALEQGMSLQGGAQQGSVQQGAVQQGAVQQGGAAGAVQQGAAQQVPCSRVQCSKVRCSKVRCSKVRTGSVDRLRRTRMAASLRPMPIAARCTRALPGR